MALPQLIILMLVLRIPSNEANSCQVEVMLDQANMLQHHVHLHTRGTEKLEAIDEVSMLQAHRGVELEHHHLAKQQGLPRSSSSQIVGIPEDNIRPLLAVTFVCSIVFASTVFAMTRTTRPNIAACTWLALDHCIAAFIAMLWFHAVRGLVDQLPRRSARTAALIVHALLLLVLSCAGAWRLRESTSQVIVFCRCAVYFTGFALAYAVLSIDHMFVSHDISSYCVLLSLAVVFLLLVSAVLYFIKKALGLRHADDEVRANDVATHPDHWPIWARRIPLYTSPKLDDALESDDASATLWAEQIEHIENECAALTLAVVWTDFAKFLIMGRPEAEHTAHERNMFLLYACILLLACMLTATICGDKLAKRNLRYVWRRALVLICSVLVMCTAWAFLQWAQMEICDHLLVSYPTFAELSVAGLSLAMMLGRVVFITSGIQGAADLKERQRSLRYISLKAMALMVGWSLEQSLDKALDIHMPGWPSVEALKVIVLFVLGVTLLPIYLSFLKPITLDIEANLS